MVSGATEVRGGPGTQDRQQRRLRGRRERGWGREQREECSSDDQINLTNVKPRLKVVKNLMFPSLPSFSKSHISPLNSKTVHCGHGTVGLEFKSSQNI